MHSSRTIRAARALAATLSLGALSACYLLQGVRGQLTLMAERKPIRAIIAAPQTPPALRARLAKVAAIREFASRELDLPNNGSYRSYADIHRPYVVWNVVAAPEFSVQAKQWCYPIVGCVAYRGYFHEAQAERFAAVQRRDGMDTIVAGAAAYSTLGHFDDPILSSMLAWDDIELAGIVFHELTHQFLYLPNDASFNEALASTVEAEGVRRWLLSQGRAADLAVHLEQEAHDVQVVSLLTEARADLARVYASAQPPDAMRTAKQARMAVLARDYAQLRTAWGGHAPFEGWFERGINNAQLASIATYYACMPGFERELRAAGGDLPRFYARVRALAKLDQTRRDRAVCGTTPP